VASVPYDVVTTEEARALAEGEPYSFLHVIRPEIDLPPGTDIHDDAVYAAGRENLDRFEAEGVLVRDEKPKLYLYRQVMHHRQQIGIVCCCHVDDYARDLIKKHETTRPDKEDDRTRHTLTLNANAGPVFMTYRDVPAVNELVHEDVNDRPLFHFNAPDGVTHTVWIVHDPAPYLEAFRHIPAAYVADGHHRAASAARAGAERRAANPDHTGEEEYNWFLSVLFPASQLQILPYNRLVADLGGHDPQSVLDALAATGRLAKTEDPVPDRPGVVCIYLAGCWHRLAFDAAATSSTDPVASLDVALLQERVLEPVLGIRDQRTDQRIEFIGGIHGPAALQQRVDAGAAAIAFSLHATSIEQLMAVADAGLNMPPKSTWFEPKLRSGLFVHTLD
jgi:uncharacterized protein (DUF1015 family)